MTCTDETTFIENVFPDIDSSNKMVLFLESEAVFSLIKTRVKSIS